MKRIIVLIFIMMFSVLVACKEEYETRLLPEEDKVVKNVKVGEYTVLKGEMETGGLGYILKSDDKSFSAIRNTKKVYTNKVTFKVKIKTSQDSGPRNGFIQAGSGHGLWVVSGVLVGAKKIQLSGNAVEMKELDYNFEKGKVLDLVLTIDMKNKLATVSIEGKTVKTKIIKPLNEIKMIGFTGNKTRTEFSEIQEN